VSVALCLRLTLYVFVDLGTMIADVMHPDLVSLQPCIEDYMDTVEAPPLRIGTILQLLSSAE